MSKNILVLYAHPDTHLSRVNRRLADAARATPGVRVHDLYDSYPDFYIDVPREQALAEAADVIVFLHPIQWYSMPSLLKEWMDTVLQPGWAYGADGHALRGKLCWLAATTGSTHDAYSAEGAHGRPFTSYLPAYEQTAAVCGMHWQSPHILFGAHHTSEAGVQAHVDAFVARLVASCANAQGD
jgi:glutathione-regulated potassium-efflux system ancillary protein KefF